MKFLNEYKDILSRIEQGIEANNKLMQKLEDQLDSHERTLKGFIAAWKKTTMPVYSKFKPLDQRLSEEEAEEPIRVI